ncbi:MAG: glycosyltransferase [Planctomycetota bacterium]|nr:glycosyltransferase [Planctomycetota bacterium]
MLHLKDTQAQIWFLLPAYNEEAGIRDQIARIDRKAADYCWAHHVVVVDDGSSDNTSSVVSACAPERAHAVIRHDRNRGPGAAFDTGFRHIVERGRANDVVITMDADCTQDLSAVSDMIGMLEGGVDVVLGSVYVPGGRFEGIPFFRLLLTTGCNLLYRLIFHVHGVMEYTAFYRGHRLASLAEYYRRSGGTHALASGFVGMTEMLLRMRKLGFRFAEVPMVVRYHEKKGKSKMKVVRNIMSHLGNIWKNV